MTARFPCLQSRSQLYNRPDAYMGDRLIRDPKKAPLKRLFRLDLQEHDLIYVVVAELPGIHRDDLSICFRGNQMLDISVNRPASSVPEIERYLIRERSGLSAIRSLHLPQASGSGISAELQSGLLYVMVPKASHYWTAELKMAIR